MKYVSLVGVVYLAVITGQFNTASAQLLAPDAVRCQAGGALLLPADKAQRRYAWASYCAGLPDAQRGHYPGGAVIESTKYLTVASSAYYNGASLTERTRLFPVYFDFVAGDWQVADALLSTSDGVIHQAQQLKIGDRLVLASGKPDAIVGVELRKELTKVYNVQPVTTDYVSNIVVAGGYLNGSLRYQNQFLDLINALILRRSLADIEASRS